MSLLKLVSSRSHRPLKKPRFFKRSSALPQYQVGEYNRCTSCGGTSWVVGTLTTVCADELCGNVLPNSESRLNYKG